MQDVRLKPFDFTFASSQIRTFQVRLAVGANWRSVEPITSCFAVEIFKKIHPPRLLFTLTNQNGPILVSKLIYQL